MIDYAIYENGNGGMVDYKNNSAKTTEAFYTMVYILMFGGNVAESTSLDDKTYKIRADWWGNNIEDDTKNWVNSQTERTLMGTSLDPNGMRAIKQAVEYDLKPIEQYGSYSVDVTFPDLDRVEISIQIVQAEKTSDIELVWNAVNNEIIEYRWL